MSITYKGALNGPWSQGGDGSVTTTRKLIFYFNAGESTVKIAQQTEIPALGSAHPDDANLILANISVSDPTEGDTVKSGKYEVTLNYIRTWSGWRTGSQDRTKEPWDRGPYDINIGPKEVVQAFVKAYDLSKPDANGNPTMNVLNPAGDPYEDTTATQNMLLRFSYNLREFNPYWVSEFCDTINDEDCQICDIGIGAGKGLLRNLSFTPAKEYDNEGELLYSYAKVDVEIEIAKRPWQREILARGLFFISGSDKPRIYCNASGACGMKDATHTIPVDEPQKLTATGGLYPQSATGGYYQTFYDKYAAAWGPMDFPATVDTE